MPDALGKFFDILIEERGNERAGCMHPSLLSLLTGVRLLVQGKENIEVALKQCRGAVDQADGVFSLYGMLDLLEKGCGKLASEQGVIIGDNRFLQGLRILRLQQLLQLREPSTLVKQHL